jgi:hypothetical protein
LRARYRNTVKVACPAPIVAAMMAPSLDVDDGEVVVGIGLPSATAYLLAIAQRSVPRWVYTARLPWFFPGSSWRLPRPFRMVFG